MERLSKYIVLTLALLLVSRIMPAQSLPPLPADPVISQGTLRCGVQYYMVTDPSRKGYAQMAVVQWADPLSQAKREALSAAFLSRMGVAPGPQGYLQSRDSATVYRFSDVPIYRTEVLDSMLLYSFEQVAACRAPQAFIVSGDIDEVELKKKMDIFSLMVPRLPRRPALLTHKWVSQPAPTVSLQPLRQDAPALVDVTYASARIPAKYMNTAQALVTDLFGAEFQLLLRHRLEKRLQEEDIAYGDIRFRALRSSEHNGDEQYSVQLQVAPEDVEAATCVLARVLGALDGYGVTPAEFTDAKSLLAPSVYRGSRFSYTDRCIANYLYGAHLAPTETRVQLYARKNLADTTETRLFNRFASALLGQLSNLTLAVSGPDTLDTDQLLFQYNLHYFLGQLTPETRDDSWRRADTLGLEAICPKVKLKSEKTESVTGGKMWTFSNGMRVVFKQVKGSGMFNYALLLNGGLAQIPKLKEGEGGYIGEILSLYDAGGLPAATFRDMLQANGIGLKADVSLNAMTLYGDAPRGKFGLLMKSLLALSGDRKLNREAFEIYSRNQAVLPESIEDVLYHRIAPGFAWSQHKIAHALTAETAQKADAFFADRFTRVNDGVLIISGDLDELSVRRILLRYLGGFSTMRGTTGRRSVELVPYSGTLTLSGPGDVSGIHILADAAFPMTAESYFTAQVAAMALRNQLVRSLSPFGYAADVSVNFRVQPQERFQLRITCLPLSPGNLPADARALDPVRALSALRVAFNDAAASLDPVDVEAWKAAVLARTAEAMGQPAGFISTLVARYAANKDVTSRYQESIQAVDVAKIAAFLNALSAGGRIEYLVP